MRRVLLCALFLGLVGSVGCKGGEEAEATVDTAKIAQHQSDLLARRDALLKARKDLTSRRDDLVVEREKVLAQGGDPADLDKQLGDLSQEQDLLGQQTSDLFERSIAELASLASSGNEQSRVAAREAALAAREKDLGRRESTLAGREQNLAGRERDLAIRERDTCGVGASTTIIQTVDAKGSRYTKKDVEPLLSRARRDMAKKGILRSDLPVQARSLEKESTKAMGEGDYGRARFAAQQLVQTIKGMKVNKAFIAAKIGRLNAAIKGKTLDGDKRATVDGLFRSATANYGDGKFSAANKKLNKIYGAIR